ncbi:hypothetical protein SAMN02910400_02585 [Lachnospiraceae bacterium C10]|nr:hypothetical protein SAMN02910400_02585 [Lachnospiraceae bacterium C10]
MFYKSDGLPLTLSDLTIIDTSMCTLPSRNEHPEAQPGAHFVFNDVFVICCEIRTTMVKYIYIFVVYFDDVQSVLLRLGRVASLDFVGRRNSYEEMSVVYST